MKTAHRRRPCGNEADTIIYKPGPGLSGFECFFQCMQTVGCDYAYRSVTAGSCQLYYQGCDTSGDIADWYYYSVDEPSECPGLNSTK